MKISKPQQQPQWQPLLGRTWRCTQSIYHERLVRADSSPHSYRVTIKRDAYDHQSYSEVQRWSGSRWELVLRCPITFLETKHMSARTKEYTDSMFDNDCDALLTEAYLITGEGNE
jgi:hypothetical protein